MPGLRELYNFIFMTFEDAGLNQELIKAIKEMGFEGLMPIQEKVIPVLLEKEGDLIGLAQTGTGKTAAFGLPIIQTVDITTRQTQALIISPSRELCEQITNDLQTFAKYTRGVNVVPVYGGANIDVQIKALNRGAHIIVATPGRLNDLLRRRKADISKINTVVLDEADEMLNMGFIDDINEILANAPKERHTLLFSATMSKEIAVIASDYMKDPLEVVIGKRNAGADNVTHSYYMVNASERYRALKRVADFYPNIYGIIFCRTRRETKEVADKLIKDGYNADALHGDLSQSQREHVMKRFKQRSLQMLVATDVAARGLDVSELSHVINYNLPDEAASYTHRSGRTGRAGKTGIAISIIHTREKGKIRQIERALGKKMEQQQVPNGKEVCEKQLFNLIDKMEKVNIDDAEIDQYLPDVYTKLERLSKEEVIKRFVALEFNRFIDYYKDAKDLNVNSKDKRNVSENRGGRVEFTRFFINSGSKSGVKPLNIITLINSNVRVKGIEIGRIEIEKKFSFFEVDSKYEGEVLRSLNNATLDGQSVFVEVAQSNPRQSRDSFNSERRTDPRRDRRRDGGRDSGRDSGRDGGRDRRRDSGKDRRRKPFKRK